MPATPKRAGREPKPNSKFIGQVLAENVRGARLLRRLTQQDLAARMQSLGHDQWTRATASEVERYGRSVSVEELVSLSLALDATIPTLLTADGIDGSQTSALDIGLPMTLPMAGFNHLLASRGTTFVVWEDNSVKSARIAYTAERQR